jgi:hypothetical protein
MRSQPLTIDQIANAVRAATFLPKVGDDSIRRLPSRLLDRITFDESGCWLWTGKINKGYGDFRLGKTKTFSAHRFVYRLLKGTIEDGLTLDHLCRIPRCVNPSHLEPVTMRENTMRGTSFIARQAIATHCKRGHPLEGENLYLRPDGDRECKTCRRMHLINSRARARR